MKKISLPRPLPTAALLAAAFILAGCESPRPSGLAQWTDEQLKEDADKRGPGHHLAVEMYADRARDAGRLDEALTYYKRVLDEAPSHDTYRRSHAMVEIAKVALRLQRHDTALRYALNAERAGVQGRTTGAWHATTTTPPEGHPLLLIREAYKNLPAAQRAAFSEAELRHAARHGEFIEAVHQLATVARRNDPAATLLSALQADALRLEIYGQDCPLHPDQLLQLNWYMEPLRKLPASATTGERLATLALEWAQKPSYTTFRDNALPLLHAAMDEGFRPTDAWWDRYLATRSTFEFSKNPEAQRLAAIRPLLADGALLRANGLRLRALAATLPPAESKNLPAAADAYLADAAKAGDADSAMEVAQSQLDRRVFRDALQTLAWIRPGALAGKTRRHPELTAAQTARLAELRAHLQAGIESHLAAIQASAAAGDLAALTRIAYTRLLGDDALPVAATPEKAAPWLARLVAHPQLTADLLRQSRGNLALLQLRGVGTPADRPAAISTLAALDGLVTHRAATVATLLAEDAAQPEDAAFTALPADLFRPWRANDFEGFETAHLETFTRAAEKIHKAAASPRRARAAASLAALCRAESTKLRERAASLRRDAATAHADGFVFRPTGAEQQFLNYHQSLAETRRVATAPVPTKKEQVVRGEVYKYDGIYYKHTVTGDKTVVVDMTPQEIAEATAAKARAAKVIAEADATHANLQSALAKRRADFEKRVESGRTANFRAKALEDDFIAPLEALEKSLAPLTSGTPAAAR